MSSSELHSNDSSPAESFYSGALDRIRRTMMVLAVIFTAAGCWRYGWKVAAGFAVGCLIAYVNFHWLKRVVNAMGERVTGGGGRQQSGSGIVLRFLLRYAFIAVGAYVIFKISPASLYGLLAGLFLPVAAILCEAAWEGYMALRRGF